MECIQFSREENLTNVATDEDLYSRKWGKISGGNLARPIWNFDQNSVSVVSGYLDTSQPWRKWKRKFKVSISSSNQRQWWWWYTVCRSAREMPLNWSRFGMNMNMITTLFSTSSSFTLCRECIFMALKRRFYVCKLRWTHFFELSKWWGIHFFFLPWGQGKTLFPSTAASTAPLSLGSISIFHLYQIEQD